MIYEMGLCDGSNCHPLLQPAVEMWRSGQPHESYQHIRNLVRQPAESNAPPFAAGDWLFASDMASICGLHTLSRVVNAAGFRHHPTEPMLGIQYAWDLAATGKFFECQKILADLENVLPAEFHSTISAINAYNFSSVGWRVSAERAHQQTVELAGQDPLTWYVLSRGSAIRSQWQLAIDEGRRAIELLPDWARARSALSDSYLAMGQVDDANKLLQQTDHERPHCLLDFSRAICAEASGDSQSLESNLLRITTCWPTGSKISRFAARHFALVLLKKGKIESAENVIKKHRLRKLESIEKESGTQKLIPVPLVAQSFNHCVPTVAAMVAGSQGVKLRPIDLADRMMTRNGTPMFRMIDHMSSLGFKSHCIRIEPNAIERLLEQGIPLIGSTVGLFSSHVDVICGFHSGLKLFHLRDPMHWFGYSIGYEDIEKHYRESGGLWALIAPDRVSDVQIPEPDLFVAGHAFVDLSRACVLGHRADAESAFQLIDDESELAFNRDRRGLNIVITPEQFQVRLDLQARPSPGETPTTAQVRAMLSQINESTADEIFELAQSKDLDLSEAFVQFVDSQCLMAKNDWRKAETTLLDLTRQFPGFENAWSNLSTVQDQLGKWDEAKSSLSCALDIAPDNESLNNRLIDLEGNNLTFAERHQMTTKLIEQTPNDPEYLRDLSIVLADGPDGLEHEQSMLKCIRFFPRDPAVYGRLAHWYWMQGRLNLAKETVSAGRELIGLEEMPILFFEEDETDGEQDGDDSRRDAENEASPNSQSDQEKSTNETHFQQLMTQVGETFNTEETFSYQDLLKIPAMVELRKLDLNGELKWWESVQLTGSLVDQLIVDDELAAESANAQAIELRKLLPRESMPGIPEHYTPALIQAIHDTIPRLMAAELVKWIDEQCLHREQFAAVEFDQAFLLEQMDLYNDSEKLLNKIIQRHPAFSPAFYRLGQISSARGDYQNAIDYYGRCLEITPANSGALNELTKLTRYLKTRDLTGWLKKDFDLYPYSKQRLYDAAFAIGDDGTDQDAMAYFEQANDQFSESGLKLLESRYWADHKQYDRALKVMAGIEPEESDQTIADWISVDCLVANEQFDDVELLLLKMVQRHPDNEEIVDQIARTIRARDPGRAKLFARKELIDGNLFLILCYICIQDEANPSEVAQKIIGRSKPEFRDPMVLLFNEALNQPEFLQPMIEFQRWAAKSYPHLSEPQSTLAVRLNMLGEDDEAISVAQKLLDQDPDNPRWLQLMGICIQDKDPKKSIGYLKREHDLTGSVESLCRIARGYQLAGDDSKARENYYAALEINPNETLAITNLAHKYDVQTESMFENMRSSIEIGLGIDDQYFHVIVVKTAIRLGVAVPEEWFGTALERFERVQAEGGFRDEESLLRKSLIAWAVQRGDSTVVKRLGNMLSPVIARFTWPRKKWIPVP